VLPPFSLLRCPGIRTSARKLGPLIGGLVATVLASGGCGDDAGGSDPGTDWGTSFDAAEVGWMMSVAGRCDALYAAGGADERGPEDFGVILRWDGGGWSEVFRGDQATDGVSLLTWVHRVDDDDVLVVGNDGVILRFDGSRWNREESGTDADLWGAWGPPGVADDLWAVGGDASGRVVLRNDGSGWRVVDAPRDDDGGIWFKVWGSGPDDVYLVGTDRSMLRWDGTGFVTPELPAPLNPGNVNDFVTVTGVGPDRVAVVGGRNNGFVLTFDGQTWREIEPIPGTPELNGVFFSSPDRLHVGGSSELLLDLDFATGEVRNEYFGVDVRPVPPSEFNKYHAIYADDCGGLWAAGFNESTSDPGGLISQRRLPSGG